ncbi:unnamed protein product [Amaranthus hypochondriacus]
MLPTQCPTQKEAIGWYPNCMLWYASRSIFGIIDEQHKFVQINGYKASNVNEFNRVLGILLGSLKVKAASGDSRLKFATGEANVSRSSDKIFALTQCNPNLSQKSCLRCLGDFIDYLSSCCSNQKGAKVVGPSCNIRYEPYIFYDSMPSPIKIPATATPPAVSTITPASHKNQSASAPVNRHIKGETEKGSNRNKIVITFGVSTLVSLVLGIVFCYLYRRRKVFEKVEEGEIASVDSLQFDFGTVKAATENFSPTNKLGHGGFGAVYKGKLSDGRDIAVKRLSFNNSGQGEKEFKNEIALLAKLQHRNLVRLLGFCLEKEERLLVYEFVPNASLDHFLFDSTTQKSLDWGVRKKIISGITRGLLYLHEDSRLRIIHRDLKAGNILLDAEMNPKIADFGLAKLFLVDETHADASKIAGTFGYMAPEYARQGLCSVKSDVYSFGILLLEIICGRKNSGFYDEDSAAGLVSLVWKNWREGTVLSIIDPKIQSISSIETEITRYIHIGLLCVQKNAADRPTMSSLIIMLSSQNLPLTLPSFPGYISETYQVCQSENDSNQLDNDSIYCSS